MIVKQFFLVLWACALLPLIPMNTVHAQTPEQVLLTIIIPHDNTADPDIVELSFDDLASLPATKFTTTTNWTNGKQEFTGVRLHDLMDHLGIIVDQLDLTAINDYSIDLSMLDPISQGALLAYLRNGNPMTARDKGPLWLVFDYDSDPAFRTEIVYSRSIWQLDRITISR